jgi:flagellar biosynthesis GTPase FlhF
MLAPVSNGVIFRKAFLDPEVLSGFVQDVTGMPFIPGKIEAEKRFNPPVGSIDVELDIFAESEDHRVVVELQRRRYGHNFDRFFGYHSAAIIDQQRSSNDYTIGRTVFSIIVLTAPYRKKDLTGAMVADPLLISSADPRTHHGIERALFGHKLIFLNPAHKADDLPPAVQGWLDFFMASMKEEDTGDRWLSREAIRRAAQLIEHTKLTPQEMRQMKDKAEEEQNVAEIEEDREHYRKEAESSRQAAAASLQEVEASRQEVEASRQALESSRQEVEASQQAAAASRHAAAASRQEAEASRQEAEASRQREAQAQSAAKELREQLQALSLRLAQLEKPQG